MSDIRDEYKKDNVDHGNYNGAYDRMTAQVKQDSLDRFRRKPWHLIAAENLKKLKEQNDERR